MKNLLKRTTAILLALFIVFQMLPVSVFAEGISVVSGADAVHTVTFDSDAPAAYLVADGAALEELPAAPEKRAADFIGWYDGDQKITAPYTPGKDTTLLARYEEWGVQTLDAAVGGATITLTGRMPSGSILSVTDKNQEADVVLLKNIPRKSVPSEKNLPEAKEEDILNLYSYDISIQKEDQSEYQPEPETPVTVTVSGEKIVSALSEGRSLRIIHTLDDGTKEIISDMTVQGDAVSFSVEHFSTFDFEAVWDMTDFSQELMEGVSVTGRMPAKVAAEASEAEVSDVLMAVDLAFSNYGYKVQPANWGGSVTVTLSNDAISGAVERGSQLKAVHSTEDGTEEQDVRVNEDGSVSFRADSRSVYAVKEITLTRTVTTSDGATYDIQVTYDDKVGVPMEGTALLVHEVQPSEAEYTAYVDASAVKLGTASAKLEFTRIFDIRIVDADDNSVVYEPSGNVRVSITLTGSELRKYPNVNVLHFTDSGSRSKGNFTISEITPSVGGETVEFTTDSFSVYVVAGYTLEKTITASDGNTYRITVEYDDNSGIPEDAELSVSEVKDELYPAYLESAALALGADIHSISYGRLFDISIVRDGVEYQPDQNVRVTVELLDARVADDVRVVHFADGENSDSVEMQAVTDGTTVSFETNSFSVFSFLNFSLLNGIFSAVLGEKTGTLYENDDIILSGSMPALGTVEAKRVEASVEGRDALVAYDIKIYANSLMKTLGIAWQPSSNVQVTIKSDALNVESVDVYHKADAETKAEEEADPVLVGEAVVVDAGSVTFSASSFSVYIVIDHENGMVVTPRVEFHFIDRYTDEQYHDGVTSSTPSAPYNFVNTNGDYQTTQILTDGETLELIANPDNVEIINEDGTSIEKYFYGWYVVNMSSDSTHLETNGKYAGSIVFNWPDNPKPIGFAQPISIQAEDADGDGRITTADTLSWSINEVSGSATMDSEATVHVYLAPIYEDFYFLNFHKGSKEDTTGLSNSLINRKLLVFGDSDSLNVHIGDVVSESPDSRHLIFAGWEEDFDEDGEYAYYRTVDMNGNEVDSDGSTSGYYITVPKRNGSYVTSLDL